jgi:4-hydroxy-tetrahydrodipicolinate synthase
MSHHKTARLRGLLTAILTPFDQAGNLALAHFPALINFQRSAGIDGLVVCGTNGEGTSLSIAERKQMLETAVAHKGGLTIVAGTGGTSVADAVDLTRHAAETGADAALVLPSFFYKNASAEGHADYFKRVLDAARLPILLYNIPQFTGVAITDEVIDRLISHPNLAGIKDSAGDWTRTHALMQKYPDLLIYAGSDLLAARAYEAGGACISGGANAFPEVVAMVRNSYQREPGCCDLDEAQNRLNALAAITVHYPLIAVSKSVLAHRGLPRLSVRPPLVNLTSGQESALIAELKAAEYL